MGHVRLRPVTRFGLALVAALAVSGCGGEDAKPPAAGQGPFVISGGPGRATVWAIGDAGHLGERERDVARLIAGATPDRLLYLGDVYERGTAKEFRAYDALYGTLAPLTAPTPGNHEWPNHETGYDRYWATRKGRKPPLHYSFELAGWKIISLNSQIFGDQAKEQVEWLKRKVAAPGDCRIAFWHEPRYSAGTIHGDEPDIEPLWQALKGKAALVLNAHEHNMQRFEPIDGIVEVISGAGGHGDRYPVDEDDVRPAFADDDHDGALRLRLSRERAELDFVSTEGEVLDSSVVRCSES